VRGAKPNILIVDGHAFRWQGLCELRRQQLEAWKAAQPSQMAAKEQGAAAVEILPDGTIRVVINNNRRDETKPEAETPKVRDFKL